MGLFIHFLVYHFYYIVINKIENNKYRKEEYKLIQSK